MIEDAGLASEKSFDPDTEGTNFFFFITLEPRVE